MSKSKYTISLPNLLELNFIGDRSSFPLKNLIHFKQELFALP